MFLPRAKFIRLAMLIAVSAASCVSLAGPDENVLGKASGYPPGTPATLWQEPFRVGSFSGMDRILHCNTVSKGDYISPLQTAANPLQFTYRYDGQDFTIDDYLLHHRVTGLLIVKDGQIVAERYQYDRKPSDRFLSNSMAKSIVSLAIGIALQEHKIKSLDDPAAKYETKLAGSAYGQTSLRNLLRMSSGVRFSEDYSGNDDLARFARACNIDGMIPAIRMFTDRPTPQGQKFEYASIESAVLAMALRAAVGCSVSQYVSEKIWSPMGAESDAKWATDNEGIELAYGYFNATLRDYARLGWLLANDGALDGRQIVPRDYLLEATDWRRQPSAFAPLKATSYFGYGYQFWTYPGDHRRFALLGIYGQSISVDPQLKLVMVHTAVTHDPIDMGLAYERDALWRGLVRHFGSW